MDAKFPKILILFGDTRARGSSGFQNPMKHSGFNHNMIINSTSYPSKSLLHDIRLSDGTKALENNHAFQISFCFW